MNEQVDKYWGLKDELYEAIHQFRDVASGAGAEDELGRAAAYVLLCWGRCRLFDIPVALEEALSILDAKTWSAGLSWLWADLRRLTNAVENEAWLDDDPTMPFVRHAQPLDILKSRLYLQGVWLVLNEPGLLRDGAEKLASHFAQRVGVFAQLLEDVDEAIDAHRDTLCVVSETAWPQNVSRTLPDDAWQPRPWWLTSEAAELRSDMLAMVHRLAGHNDPTMRCLRPMDFGTVGDVTPAHYYVGKATSAASPEFRIAADSSQQGDKIQIAAFSQDGLEKKHSVRLYLPSEYSHRRLTDLASSVPIDVVVVVDHKREQTTDKQCRYGDFGWEASFGTFR